MGPGPVVGVPVMRPLVTRPARVGQRPSKCEADCVERSAVLQRGGVDELVGGREVVGEIGDERQEQARMGCRA